MYYSETSNLLKKCFELQSDEIQIPDSELIIRNFSFQSVLPDEISFSGEDKLIRENFQFRYPVIMKKGSGSFDRALIFLHGLNERTWFKHLAGAKMLSEQSGQPVIMFPLSFHINRGLPEWIDVRKMSEPLAQRKNQYAGISDASVINLALSKRLTDDPGRFLSSGFQSTIDLIGLIKIIKSGDHPVFNKGASVDLFAYSISCMLLQSLMICNPDNILNGSRIVLFAGGSVFEQMNGVSKYIMDSIAFSSVRKYYLNLLTAKKRFYTELEALVDGHKFGQAFRSLISANRFRSLRLKGLSAFHNDLMILSLRNDKVMQVQGIAEATGEKFSNSKNFRILDFPYPYTHENPFPVLNNKLEKQVEIAFQSVFNPALRFFSGDHSTGSET